jgi:hypothetical protein
MTLFLDPVASLKQDTLVFRAQARHENEIAPHLGRLLPTGGYLFSEQVQERLAQITGLTFAKLLPTGSAPPRIDVTTDRQITLRTQHANPEDAARRFAAELWRCGHASQVETKSLGQLEVRINRLPVRVRFTPDRRALLRYLHQRLEGRKTQLATLADRCG